jgi:hypothetical protein
MTVERSAAVGMRELSSNADALAVTSDTDLECSVTRLV